MNKIKRVSLFFCWLFQLCFILLPTLQIYSWMHSLNPIILLNGMIRMNSVPQAYTEGMGHALSHLTIMQKLVGFSVDTIPLVIKLFILYALIKLFKLYEQGEIFSSSNVSYIKKIGYALLIGQLINPIHQCLMGVVLSWNTPGHRYFSITLDQTNVGIIVIALLVILISWIMAEGCQLREEQNLTI